jgi:DNA-binding NarL/FixJ family response regulator
VSAESPTPIRVVLADDQPMVRAGIAMLLSAQPDIEVSAEVSDGAEAVAAAETLHPDIVVMDLRMPGLDGIEATRAITADNAERPDHLVKVLALTTFDDDDMVYGALRAGAQGFLLKHAAPSDLVSAIRRVAAGDAWIDPMVAGKVISDRAADPTRAGGADVDRRWALEHRDQPAAGAQRGHREDPRVTDSDAYRLPRPGPGRGARLPQRPGLPVLTSNYRQCADKSRRGLSGDKSPIGD